jgi:hypothetical protein
MIAVSLAIAVSAAWIFRAQTNLLGQPEAVAELSEQPSAPGQFMRFSCSVLSGPVFEVGLGARSFDDFSKFSAARMQQTQKIALTIAPANGTRLQVLAEPSVEHVTAHAYVVGGTEAVNAARAVADAASVAMSTPEASAEFSATGAQDAISQTIAACPFAGPAQP